MKLLIYSHFFAPSVGGVETVVKSLAAGLANSKTPVGNAAHEVTVITNTPGSDANESTAPYRVVRQPTLPNLRKLIQSVDLVHVAGAAILPIREALRAGKPVVVEHHGFQTICPTGQLLQEPQDAPCPGYFMKGNHGACLRCRKTGSFYGSLRLWLLTFYRRKLCRQVDANLVPTAWLGEQLKLPRMKTVPHGLPPSDAIVRLAGNPKAIVFVGRLVTTKGVRLLLEAARKLKAEKYRFELRLIGGGPERKSLELQAKEYQLEPETKFLGPIPNERLEENLVQAAVVAVPSLGGEVFGMVVAENMLHGLPVIASDLGSFAEVLGNREQTFETGNADDLARQLARVLDDAALGESWAQTGRRRVLEGLTEQQMIENHERVYRELLESRARVSE